MDIVDSETLAYELLWLVLAEKKRPREITDEYLRRFQWHPSAGDIDQRRHGHNDANDIGWHKEYLVFITWHH